MIRRLFYLSCFVLIVIQTPKAASGLPSFPLRSFEAEYHIRKTGVTVGKLKRSLKSAQKNDYQFSSHAKTSGLAALFNSNETEEMSAGQYVDDTILPLRYAHLRTKGGKKKSDSIMFMREQELLAINRRGARSERPLTSDGLDKLSYQLQLMLDLLSGNNALSYTIETPSKKKTYNAEKKGEEELSTPAGNYYTTRIEQLTSKEKRTTFWCAEELQYLPVKVIVSDEDGKTEIVLANFHYTD